MKLRTTLPLLLLGIFFPSNLFAESTYTIDPALDRYFTFLTQSNAASPLETAGAHGPAGFRLGGGATSVAIPDESRLYFDRDFRHTSAIPARALFAPKLWVTKGLLYPVDVGMTAASLPGDANQVGAYLQLTVFEALGLPALGLRASGSRIFGMQTTEFSSQTVEAVGSWGIYVASLYLGLGMGMHRGRTQIDEITVEKVWTQPIQRAGLALQLFPPFVILTGEMQRVAGSPPALTTKLSIGI